MTDDVKRVRLSFKNRLHKRLLLDDRQVRLVLKDLTTFGYKLTFAHVRKIADDIADGTHNTADPVAMIIVSQIDEALGAPRDG